jgi:hypothetical protein
LLPRLPLLLRLRLSLLLTLRLPLWMWLLLLYTKDARLLFPSAIDVLLDRATPAGPHCFDRMLPQHLLHRTNNDLLVLREVVRWA